jgi:hypothetical protein
MSDSRPLSKRETEILSFLLTAPGIPDIDILRQQAAVARVSRSCPCGCATIDLTVDRSSVSHARRDLRADLVETLTVDIAREHEMEPLRFYAEDGAIDPHHQVTPDDLSLG